MKHYFCVKKHYDFGCIYFRVVNNYRFECTLDFLIKCFNQIKKASKLQLSFHPIHDKYTNEI